MSKTEFMTGITEFIRQALDEDIGNGDHTTLSTIPVDAQGKAYLLVKQDCILAGVDVAKQVFTYLQEDIRFKQYKADGEVAAQGMVVFEIEGCVHTILSGERLVLNIMQRMSGIATHTHRLTEKIKHTKARLLDTRKTTPLFRMLEKEAVRIGGGLNHRMGLYDMILIKDNHIDFAGGITQAINRVNNYLKSKQLQIPIEIEVRSMEELQQVLEIGMVDRILLDNFSPNVLKKGVALVNGRFQTEASGGITELNIASYAETGVDFISVGALTHHVNSIDLSLKANLTP